MKPASVLIPIRKNISGMSKHVLMDQTLQNNHAWSFDHRIDFDNSRVINKSSFCIRKTLEAWHTSATKHADNNSKLIPNQYSILFKQLSPFSHFYFAFVLLIIFSCLFCIYFTILHSMIYPSKAIDGQLKADVLF